VKVLGIVVVVLVVLFVGLHLVGGRFMGHTMGGNTNTTTPHASNAAQPAQSP
jgi:hypothetical protein